MIRRPPRSTRTDTLFPYTTLFRSMCVVAARLAGSARMRPVGPSCDRAVAAEVSRPSPPPPRRLSEPGPRTNLHDRSERAERDPCSRPRKRPQVATGGREPGWWSAPCPSGGAADAEGVAGWVEEHDPALAGLEIGRAHV